MHVYIAGVGGAGLGPLALIAHDAGYTVTASDQNESPNTHAAQERGIAVVIGQNKETIAAIHAKQPIEMFVYTGAITPGHPEYDFAREQGIPMTMMYGLLNKIATDKKLQLIAVAGTHGKTTTSGMTAWVFKQLAIPASYLIGSTLTFGPSGTFSENSSFLIVEADEYHRKFLDLKPAASLITSIDYDHPDTYPTPEDYYAAFSDFLEQSQMSWMWPEDAHKLARPKTHITTIDGRITLPGEHMRRNASLVLQGLSTLLGPERETGIVAALNTFPGTNRRFEKIAENIYSDYGHHPVEVAATLQMINEVHEDIIVLYQPHQNVRQQQIVDDGGYGDSFARAKKVYWLPTYLSREVPGAPVLSSAELISTTSNPAIFEPAEMNEALAQKLKHHAGKAETVVLMAAGDADQWLRSNVST